MLEFDPNMHKCAGDDLAEYWDFLSNRFKIYAFVQGDRAQRVSGEWSIARTELGSSGTHTDLIVVCGSPTPNVLKFLAKWTID